MAGTMAFKAICGSSPATAATFASVGTLGILIPPSVTLIVFGIITEQSIGRLFLAGIVPGLLIAAFFALTILVWCSINPSLGPKGAKSGWRERLAALVLCAALLFAFPQLATLLTGLLMK